MRNDDTKTSRIRMDIQERLGLLLLFIVQPPAAIEFFIHENFNSHGSLSNSPYADRRADFHIRPCTATLGVETRPTA